LGERSAQTALPDKSGQAPSAAPDREMGCSHELGSPEGWEQGLARESNFGELVQIRPASAEDAPRIATLAGQLGYPSTPQEVLRRLEQIQAQAQHAVFVAARAEGQAVGWVHAFVSYLVESEPHAEIGGLVVDEGHRGERIGRLLLQHAEDWAREQGCASVYLRSNILRQGARAFYERGNYSLIKTQHAFRKVL
jgi:GNAT superfamily N-acetyltransferase